MSKLNFMFETDNIGMFIQLIKTTWIAVLAYSMNFKIIDVKFKSKFLWIISILGIILLTSFSVFLRYDINFFVGLICLILFISIIFSRYKVSNSITVTVISVAINYSISFCSVIINYFLNKIINVHSDYVNLATILIIHLVIWFRIINIKKLKYGITFLKNNSKNEYMDILVLNVGWIGLSSIILIETRNVDLIMKVLPIIIINIVSIFITIKTAIQLYYKQKLLIKEVEETKEKLADKEREIEKLEQENLSFSQKSHSLAHKQRSLEHKINKLMLNAEIAEEIDIKNKVEQISKELYDNSTITELPKTDIEEIDDMLSYMQEECIKNKIDMNLQINGNIYYMINNIVSKEELEILIADHIKDAIIAINHTDNVNKSILVKLGIIDDCYGLYIYDSGIEFEKETLENLGKKPITTHKDEGGTGMGFMNTFDTLRKNKGSLIIKEIGKPSAENYTKVIMIKFNNENEFKVDSYKRK